MRLVAARNPIGPVRCRAYFLGATALAASYAVLAKLGLMLDAVAGLATPAWPPTGISLAALLLFGGRFWPGVMAGALVANLWAGAPLLVATPIALGSTLEAVLGAFLIRRLPGFRPSLERPADVVALILLGGLISTTVSATIGTGSLAMVGIIAPQRLAHTWLVWWIGDLMGDLLVAPLLLVWVTAPRPRLHPPRILIEAAALGLTLTAIGLLVFIRPSTLPGGLLGQLYLIFPGFIWAALRFRQRGAVTVTMLVSVIAIWGTAQGRGPFASGAIHERLLFLQTFMAVVVSTTLILGAAIHRRVCEQTQTSMSGEMVPLRGLASSRGLRESQSALLKRLERMELRTNDSGPGALTGSAAQTEFAPHPTTVVTTPAQERWRWLRPGASGQDRIVVGRRRPVLMLLSAKDRALADELHGHLQVLDQQELIALQRVDDLLPGETVAAEQRRRLYQAEILLVLLSADLLRDQACGELLDQALTPRGAAEPPLHVIPVPLRPCAWRDTALGALQPLPEGGEPVSEAASRDGALLAIASGLRRLALSKA